MFRPVSVKTHPFHDTAHGRVLVLRDPIVHGGSKRPRQSIAPENELSTDLAPGRKPRCLSPGLSWNLALSPAIILYFLGPGCMSLDLDILLITGTSRVSEASREMRNDAIHHPHFSDNHRLINRPSSTGRRSRATAHGETTWRRGFHLHRGGVAAVLLYGWGRRGGSASAVRYIVFTSVSRRSSTLAAVADMWLSSSRLLGVHRRRPVQSRPRTSGYSLAHHFYVTRPGFSPRVRRHSCPTIVTMKFFVRDVPCPAFLVRHRMLGAFSRLHLGNSCACCDQRRILWSNRPPVVERSFNVGRPRANS